MENSRQNNLKLLSLLSQIRQLVGDFDATSIFEKVEQNRESYDAYYTVSEFTELDILTATSDERRTLESDESQKSTILQQLSLWRNKRTLQSVDSPESNPSVTSALDVFGSDIQKADLETEASPSFNLTPQPSENLQPCIGKSDLRTSMHNVPDSYATTPLAYKQKRHISSANRFALSQIGNSAAEATEKMYRSSYKISSVSSERLYGGPTPSKNLNIFMEELPSDSPVRLLITNCIGSVSPVRPKSKITKDIADAENSSANELGNEKEKLANFLEFVSIGVNRDSLNEFSISLHASPEDQVRNLMKVQRGKLEISDQFKVNSSDERNVCMIETISDYCFPEGMLLDVILKSDISTYTGENNDSMHVLQFSDVSGLPTYACCLIVTESVQPRNTDIVRALLEQKKSYQKAVGIIIKAFQYVLKKRKEGLLVLSKNTVEADYSIFDMKHSFYSLSTPFKFGGGRSNVEVEDSDVKATGAGFGSALISRLKLGMSFAGGRTTEKAHPSKTPSLRTNKVLWSDLDETDQDNEDDEPDEHQVNKGTWTRNRNGHKKSDFVMPLGLEEEKEEFENNADNECNDGEDDERSSDGRDADTPVRSSSSCTPALQMLSTDEQDPGSSDLSAQQITSGESDFPRSHQSTIQAFDSFSPSHLSSVMGLEEASPPLSGPRGRDRGHSLQELQGLHLNGFSSESEEEEEEGEELDSSCDSYTRIGTRTNDKNGTGNAKYCEKKKRKDSTELCGVGLDLHSIRSLDAECLTPILTPKILFEDSQLNSASKYISMNAIDEETSQVIESLNSPTMIRQIVPKKCPQKGLFTPENLDDYVVVTKKAFCILSSLPSHSFFFSVLSALVEEERTDAKEIKGKNNESKTTTDQVEAYAAVHEGTHTVGGLAANTHRSRTREDREEFLKYMSSCRLLKNSLHSSSVKNIPCSFSRKYFQEDVYRASFEDWCCGLLLCLLPSSTIMKTLSLLLLENSLVVCGPPSASGLVTAVASAFLLLLKPFQWAGIFVPMLPSNALEVMEAPVPFIVGTIHTPRSSYISESAAVIHLGDFLGGDEGPFLRPLCYLNTQNLRVCVEGDVEEDNIDELIDSADDDQVNDLTNKPEKASTTIIGAFDPKTPTQSSRNTRSRVQGPEKKYLQLPASDRDGDQRDFSLDLSYQDMVCCIQKAKTRLYDLHFSATNLSECNQGIGSSSCISTNKSSSKNKNSSFNSSRSGTLPVSIHTANSLMARFITRMTPEERTLVSDLLRSLRGHNNTLCGSLAVDSSAWQKYGVANTSSGDFDFYPEMFLDPLKARLEFQEELAHTQMFVSYVDKKRNDHNLEIERQR